MIVAACWMYVKWHKWHGLSSCFLYYLHKDWGDQPFGPAGYPLKEVQPSNFSVQNHESPWNINTSLEVSFFKSKIKFHPFSSIFINLNMTCHTKWRNSWMKFLEIKFYHIEYHTSSYLTDSFFAIDFPAKNVAPQGDLRQGEAHHPWRPGCARGGSGEFNHQPEILRCLTSDRQKASKNLWVSWVFGVYSWDFMSTPDESTPFTAV